MARKSLKAEFFASMDGTVIIKAKPLKSAERKAIYIRDRGKCQLCHVDVKFGGINSSPFELIASGQIDHIFPRSRGGQNNKENLRLLCLTCNSQKGAK